LILFLRRKVCDKDEKSAFTFTKLKSFHENQEFKTMKKQIYKVFRVIYNEFKNSLECDPG